MSGDILDDIDDVLTGWEGSADSADWAADGSHEYDPLAWTLDPGCRCRLNIEALLTWLDQPVLRIPGLTRLRPASRDIQLAIQAQARWWEARAQALFRAEQQGPMGIPPHPDAPPEDPRERALWARRNRGTGPASPRLDGRRR